MSVKHFFSDARPNGIHGGTRKNPDTGGVEVEIGGYHIPLSEFLEFSEIVAQDPDVAKELGAQKHQKENNLC